MKHYITAGMMVMGILIATGCQKSVSEGTEGAEIAGSDPDNIPVYPRDVHGTVSSMYGMEYLKMYLYDANGEQIGYNYWYYGLEHSQTSQEYDFCDDNINAYGHPYPWYVCVEIRDAAKNGPYYRCSDPIYSRSFTEQNCSPSRPSAHRDIYIAPGNYGTCAPNPCGD